ncbi:hypothetical protein OF83DRAFT_375323 [Amylostereum chailletii]|nr:hypothetical protein OF83DRAFT_375323 [Amylostereum chailletii]
MVDVPIVEVARFVFGWADNQRTKKQIEVGERTLENALSVYNDNKGLLSENDKRTIEQKFQESRRLQGKVATRSWPMKPLSARTFKLKTAETLAETITLSGTAREKHVLGCRTGALRGPQAGDGVEVWHNGDRIYWCADSNVQVRFMIRRSSCFHFSVSEGQRFARTTRGRRVRRFCPAIGIRC